VQAGVTAAGVDAQIRNNNMNTGRQILNDTFNTNRIIQNQNLSQ
jgi:hypothetical protein